MRKITICLSFVLMSLFSWSQVTNEGIPESWKHNFQEIAPVFMPKFDLEARLAEDEANDQEALPYRFGYEFDTNFNLNNSGKWDELPNGDRIWRIRFKSKDALTMNFLLEDFYLPKHSKIYLYTHDRSDLIGAYDAQQNNGNEVLSTWLVEGEDVWIEYYEPKKVKNQGRFSITKAVHGYRSQTAFKIEKGLNDSGACNHDVDCPIGDMDEVKDHVKKSVALMLVGSNSFCTGSLVNNTSNDGTPYFLTANHCFSNPAFWSFRFNWISPNPVCSGFNGSQQDTNTLTISGSTLRARRFNSDFCLVEINNDIPSSWDVVWSGWDRSDNIPSRTFGVHHPSGDIMKVARDDNAPGKLNTGGENVWRVFNWDLGVTEGGSSGSALFDEDGRIVGQLWRGLAACSGLNDNNQWDEYGRFGVSWDAGGSSSNQLSNWLDPNNTGQITLDAFPALEVLDNDLAVLVEGLDDICDDSVSPDIILFNLGNNAITSVTVEYAFNSDATTTINWTGNLSAGESEVISVPEYALQVEANTFLVDAILSGDENLNNNQSSKDFEVAETVGSSTLELTIVLDNYPDETTWEVIGAAGNIIANGGPYFTEGATVNETIILPSDDCYTFTIFDVFEDGICCGYGFGSYTLETDNGIEIVTGGDFGSSESTSFNNFITLSNDSFSLNNEVKLYPNPTNGITYLSNSTGNVVSYQVFSIAGKLIRQGEAGSSETVIDLTNVNSGIYLVKLTDAVSQVTATKKIIVK